MKRILTIIHILAIFLLLFVIILIIGNLIMSAKNNGSYYIVSTMEILYVIGLFNLLITITFGCLIYKKINDK